MSQIEILLPKMGESVAEATIIKWLKNEGDRVEPMKPWWRSPRTRWTAKCLPRRQGSSSSVW
jgi:hypothetical protein